MSCAEQGNKEALNAAAIESIQADRIARKAAAKERRAEMSVQNGEIKKAVKKAAKAAKCEEKAATEAAVAATLKHEGLLRAAERAVNGARAAVSKAMIEAERKKKAAAEAMIEY